MVDEENLYYVISIIADERRQIERIPGVIGTGITHSSITGIGKGYQLLVNVETSDIVNLIPRSINGILVITEITGKIYAY